MRRREFIVVLGAFSAAPLRAFAQRLSKLYRMGVLTPDNAAPGLLEGFEEGLRELGYVRGQNIFFEERDAQGDYQRRPVLAYELVSLKVDVILAVNTPAVQARASDGRTDRYNSRHRSGKNRLGRAWVNRVEMSRV